MEMNNIPWNYIIVSLSCIVGCIVIYIIASYLLKKYRKKRNNNQVNVSINNEEYIPIQNNVPSHYILIDPQTVQLPSVAVSSTQIPPHPYIPQPVPSFQQPQHLHINNNQVSHQNQTLISTQQPQLYYNGIYPNIQSIEKNKNSSHLSGYYNY